MSLNESDQKKRRTRKFAAAFFITAAVIAALALWASRNGSGSGASEPALQVGGKTMSEAEIARDLEKAAGAVLEGRPATRALTTRPEFVSEIEWQILQSAARQRSSDSTSELTSLVNKLLFAKKREAWLASSNDSPTRHELARQLLDMIPQQIQDKAIDQVTAKNLERELQNDLAQAAR